jgi:hypothetical protein
LRAETTAREKKLLSTQARVGREVRVRRAEEDENDVMDVCIPSLKVTAKKKNKPVWT